VERGIVHPFPAPVRPEAARFGSVPRAPARRSRRPRRWAKLASFGWLARKRGFGLVLAAEQTDAQLRHLGGPGLAAGGRHGGGGVGAAARAGGDLEGGGRRDGLRQRGVEERRSGKASAEETA
jgi:hypothetical protein